VGYFPVSVGYFPVDRQELADIESGFSLKDTARPARSTNCVGACMLSACNLVHSSGVSRTVYVVCTFIAFSYILTDVLDLDGWNYARLRTPVERILIVAEAGLSTEIVVSPKTAPWWTNVPDLSTDWSREFNRFRQTKTVGLAALDWAHRHNHRL